MNSNLELSGGKIRNSDNTGNSLIQINHLNVGAIVGHSGNIDNAWNSRIVATFRVRTVDGVILIPNISIPLGIPNSDL